MATKSISQLDTASSLALGDLFETAIPDTNSATGYTSRKTSLTNMADFIQSTAANNSLETTAKTIVGAINEVDAESVKWEQENILGCKNLIPYKTYDPSGTVQNGIKFDVNEDGTIIANGTKVNINNNATFNITERYVDGGMFLPNGTYILTGCPSGGSVYTYQLGAAYLSASNVYSSYGFDDGEGVEFTVNGSRYSEKGCYVRIFFTFRGGYASADNIEIKPMIRLKGISDANYTAPTLPNRNLTLYKLDGENVAPLEFTDLASIAYTAGEYMIWRGKLYKVTAPISAGGAITDGTNVTQTTIGAELKALFDALS